MAEGKLDMYVKKLQGLDVKGVVEKAIAADKLKSSKKGQKLLAECNKLYVAALKNSKQYDETISAQYDEVVGLMTQMTEESLAQAEARIIAMKRMLATAWSAYKGIEKGLAAIRKEYKLA